DGIRDFHVTGVQTCALPICGGGSIIAICASDEECESVVTAIRAAGYQAMPVSLGARLDGAERDRIPRSGGAGPRRRARSGARAKGEERLPHWRGRAASRDLDLRAPRYRRAP